MTKKKTTKASDQKESTEKAGEHKEKEAEQKAVSATFKEKTAKKAEAKEKEKSSKATGADEHAKKDEMKSKEAKHKAIAAEGRGSEASEKAMQQGEAMNKALEKAEKTAETTGKQVMKDDEKNLKSSEEKGTKSIESKDKTKTKMTQQEAEAKEQLGKLNERQTAAVTTESNSGKAKEAAEKDEEKKAKVDETKKKEMEAHKVAEEEKAADEQESKNGITRSEQALEDAADASQEAAAKSGHDQAKQQDTERSTKWTTAKAKTAESTQKRDTTLGEEKDAKNEHQSAESFEAGAKTDLETIATKISEEQDKAKASETAVKNSEKNEVDQKATIKKHGEKEKASKDKAAERATRLEKESTKKETDSKAHVKETEEKKGEKQTKATEVAAKTTEKGVKQTSAEKKEKKETKEQLWAEQQQKLKEKGETNAKEKKKKADCAAKQEQEQEIVRFTLAQDKIVENNPLWQNFANGYEGIRLQKQGNICLLSGLIRSASENIVSGVDANKVFWHAEMETLIQTGESATAGKQNNWEQFATVGGHCKPTSAVELLANNHAEVTKVKIDNEGRVTFVSGGQRHGWISLNGLAWKAGGPLQGKESGDSIASIGQFKENVILENGWQGQGLDVYKQGHVCFVSGKLINGRNFEGSLMVLPPSCRPKAEKTFMFAHDKEVFALKVGVDGAVKPHQVNDNVAKSVDLNNIVFSTSDAEDFKLDGDKGWTVSPGAPKPEAQRQGSLCVLSGTAHNADVREGHHSLLKNSGQPGTLPEWCRPRNRMAFSTIQVGSDGVGVARIDVLPTGAVRWVAGSRQKNVNLDGIKFDVKATIVKKFSAALLKVSECE
jgi:hypothetical protein